MKLFRYRRRSLSTTLGVTKMKKRANKSLGITAAMKPFRAPKNLERKLKRSAGYYSEPAKAIRHASRVASSTKKPKTAKSKTVTVTTVVDRPTSLNKPIKPNSLGRRLVIGCRNSIVALVALMIISVIVQSAGGGGNSTSDGLPTLSKLPSLTWTPETVALVATEPPGVTIIPTEIRASSGFITMTPAPGSTDLPTPTITDTPQPTATNTKLPTATNVPVSTPTIAVRSIGSVTYYLTRTANVRSCASSKCDKLGVVDAGTSMTVSGIVQGETVTGSNSTWYQVQYGGMQAYIYSAYLTDRPPVQVQQPVIVQQQPIQPVVVQQQPAQQEVQQPAAVDSSSGATALCNDGTYSYSANHRGTCSHHGGVAVWYK